MRKLKLIVAACALMGTGQAWAQTDVTSTYLTNAGFDNCTAEISDVAAKTIKDYSSVGWTKTSSGDYTTIAVTAYGSGVKLATSTTPSTKKDGTTVQGNTLGIIAGWADNVTLQSNEITLPAGFYTLTIDHYTASSYTTNQFISTSSKCGFITASTSYLVSSTTFQTSKWTTETVTFTLTESTTGKIQIGLKGNNKQGSETSAVFYDDVTLTWTDPDLAAAQLTLGGYIKKGTALNTVLDDTDLASAISTAQSTLDGATTASACNTAASTLNTAITTALSGTTAVSLTNGNFDTTPNLLADGTVGNDDVFYYNANNASEAYNYNVTGWTNASVVSSNASFGGTGEYGSTATICGTTPPAADMFGANEGAALALADGWGSTSRYQQVKESLPAGRYLLYFEAYNQNTATGIGSNYFGASGAAGDFYGTTNGFVYDSNKTFASGEWKATAIEFDVAKVADITIGVGMGGSGSSSGNAKLWIDNVLVYRIGDVIVTEADANALISQVEALDDAVYNATDKSALATAKTTFEGNKTLDNYKALSAALVTAQNSVTVYTALNTAITNAEGWTTDAENVTTSMRTKYTNGTYSDETTAADIYEEYQAAELAALVDAEATDYTSAILNHSFETGDMTGWSAESRTDTGVKKQSNSTYSINSGDAVDGSYLFNSWGGTAENNVYQTIKGLPAGTYTLSALVAGFNGENLVLAANSETATVTVAGNKTVGYTANVVFTLDAAADVVIKASNTKSQEGSDASFIKADNFRLVKGDITTTDFTALNAAIDAAEAKTLGFEAGDYAPYNNIDALEKLAAAKAVDQTSPIIKTTLDAIVSDLTDATWTVNAEEVNAFYDGTFATREVQETSKDGTKIPGWTSGNNIRQILKTQATFPGLADATDGTALFAWSGGASYGNDEGYEMPLKANSIYKLNLKVAGWNNETRGDINVSVLNGSDGMATISLGKADKDIKGNDTNTAGMTSMEILFATGAAGNYVFSISSANNIVFTDVELKKATNQYLEFADNADMLKYAPGTYPTVKITRTLTADRWATAVYPFAVSGVDNIAVLDSYDAETGALGFSSATASTANVPFLMRSTSAKSEISLSNVEVVAAAATDATATEASLKGVYAATAITNAEKNYVLSQNKIYSVGEDGATINPYRAYIQIAQDAPARALTFFVDGEATAIEGVSAESQLNGKVYNLSGQQVEKAQKGIYVVNGKKVVIK